ncbi:hypothetical protein BKA64DRAFT_571134 [Cadophora sp. MPI-SDFR-AT-0126]|nr:hypothetical protein BKA64DRAFT_571134 [Leotiomycetes sp. MPI-SDFR-AT-0126]
MVSRRNVRIANVSGATGDDASAMRRMVETGEVDIITGDWLSEMNIAWNAIAKADDPSQGYEVGFLTQLETCMEQVVAKGLKVITNAGALNTTALTAKVKALCVERDLGNIVVASVVGDDITEALTTSASKKGCLADGRHLDHSEWRLSEWARKDDISSAVAYIGAWGIVASLDAGANIVICGRVTDASPVIGAAAWWYGWKEDDFDQLAGALIAGHLIECGLYATGANFSGFKSVLPNLIDLPHGIAEILPSGQFFVTKPENTSGLVNEANMRAQFLYELQGELYLNPDVVADVSNISIEDSSENRVIVSCVKGLPPPDTAKAMIAASGGFQCETTFYINGLNVQEKAQMMRQQLSHMFRDCKFSKLSIELYGIEAMNPSSQQAGTVFLRIFAQAARKDDVAAKKFRNIVYALRMQSYPGYHMNLDFRTKAPKPFMEIFPALIPVSAINHQAIVGGRVINVLPPRKFGQYSTSRPSYETANPVDLESFGRTEQHPLGSIVHARSGDKANNSNVGFFVRHKDEYLWLQSLLTVERLKLLLGDDWTKGDQTRRIERAEFPNILAVHFRILDFLDGGIASSARVDGLGKGIGEYLRSRHVEVPVKFLERGRID